MATDTSNDRIAAVLERLAENQPVQEIGYAHPKFQEGLRKAGYFHEFAKPVYQNGKASPATCLSLDLIAKTNKLRDGKYLGGVVTVAHDQSGATHLLYKTATADDRMRNIGLFSSFEDLIDKITAEMPAAVSPAS